METLTERGFSVVGVDIRTPEQTKAVDFFNVNLSKSEEIEQFAAEFGKQYQSLHALINNAGIVKYLPVRYRKHWYF